MDNIKRIASLLTFAVPILLTGCVAEKTSDETDSLPLGVPMPQFSVSGPDRTVTADDLAGMRSVIVFFRSTCPDCHREMPKVEAAFRRVDDSGTRFVTISKEVDATTAVPEHWSDTGMTVPYYFDPEGTTFAAFNVRYVPTLYLFGSDGKVAYAAVETFGFSEDELVKLIEELK